MPKKILSSRINIESFMKNTPHEEKDDWITSYYKEQRSFDIDLITSCSASFILSVVLSP